LADELAGPVSPRLAELAYSNEHAHVFRLAH
jgi:hypothetical protein